MEILLMILQIILACGNLCMMIYAFKIFLSKPRQSLEKKVLELEVAIKEVKESLLQGNDNFRSQKQTNEILVYSMLALIEFEIQYCLTEKKTLSPELQRAKDELQRYLSRK